ncbi:hypothetical protein ACFLY4_07325 [Chloroflexota bacterium]
MFTILPFIPLSISSREIDLAYDFTDVKTDLLSLQACQILSISAAVLIWLLDGKNGMFVVLPLLAAVIGVSLVFLSTSLVNNHGRI